MEPGLLVAIEGPSAAGKTTVTEAIARSAGWVPLGEAYRRLSPPLSLEFRSPEELLRIERTLLREEARRYSEASERLATGASVLADTGFLGPLTYTLALVRRNQAPPSTLTTILEEARGLGARGEWGLADGYVYLDTSAEVQAARASSDPAGAAPALAARHRELGAIEREFYLEHFARLWGRRFRVVPADRPPSEVAVDVTRCVADFAEMPDATVRLEDVLGLLADAAALPETGRGNR
jgi:hypothetical protein